MYCPNLIKGNHVADMKIEKKTIFTFTVLSSDALNIEFPSLAKSTHRTLAE